MGIPAYGLDGDNIRHGLCKNLGFKKEDRSENIRRVAEVAKLLADMGVISLVSFISPFTRDRAEARRIHQAVISKSFFFTFSSNFRTELISSKSMLAQRSKSVRREIQRVSCIFINSFSFPSNFSIIRSILELYKKARAGQIHGFTGIDSAYEVPTDPDMIINAGQETEAQCLQRMLQFLYQRGILPEKVCCFIFKAYIGCC